ncbi:MAG: TetR family transcriptional regulator [Phenylobacterium sp.]|nr:TetR family transcriptional regulator [Phenylobacterium sp.]
MKVSRQKVSENRQKILKAASRLFRERGFDGVTVAEIMKAAGLTHGGFYGYFKSKEDLIANALQDALSDAPGPSDELAAYAAEYLAPKHRDDLAGGCPTAGLAAESLRQTPEARAALTAGLRRQIERLSRAAPGADPAARRRAAIGSWAAMVGALVLSRVSDDRQLSDELLSATRDWIAGT